MKKIFSYILIFVFLFAISTTVTIKIGQTDQNGGKGSQTTTSAGANESLLNGLMSSFEKNPKQSAQGSINVTIDGQPVTLFISANLNLQTITNPEVQGSLRVSYGTDNIDAIITYTGKTLYFSANNMQLMVKIDDISDLVSFIKDLTSDETEGEQPDQSEAAGGEEPEGEESSPFDVNALMAAIENPKKTVVDNQMFFEINLQGICTLNMVCDLSYNLQKVTVSNFALLEGISIDGEISLVADSNIQITAPNTDNYLDVGAVANSIQQLIGEDYLSATIWGSVYKNGQLAQYVDALATADLTSNKYSVNASLSGLVDGNVGLAIIDNWAYVNYNDIYLKTDIATIKDVAKAVINNVPKADVSGEVAEKVNELIEWLKQNYKQLLEDAIIASDQVLVVADMAGILGQKGEVIFQLGILQGQISSIKLANVTIADYTANLSIYLSRPSTLNIAADESMYFNLQPVLQVVGSDKAISTIVSLANSRQFSGNINLDFGDIYASGEYVIDITEGVKAQAKLNICDIDVFIAYQNNIIYADVLGLKISLQTSEISEVIDWVNTILVKFNKQPIDLSGTNKLTDKLGEFKLTDITDVTANGSTLSANVFGANISLTIDSFVEVSAVKDKLSASLTLMAGGELQEIVDSEYQPYTNLTDIIDAVLDLVDQRQFKIDATATVYEGTDIHYYATCVGEIDIANFAVYLNISVTDFSQDSAQPMNFMVAYKAGMWYVDYNNLKISINKDDLAEIAVILLKALGINIPSALEGILGDAIKNTTVDASNISTIMPNIDTANPISMLKYLKGLSINGGNLTLIIDSSLVNSDVAGKDMNISLKTANGKVTALALTDIYTGVTDGEHFDLTLTLGELSRVSDPDAGNYINLSGSNELIKAIINTAELNYFNITGTLDIEILGITLNVPLDIKVKLDASRMPEVMISLPKIPVIGSNVPGFTGINVNNDVPYVSMDMTVKSRMANIYYKDGYVYIYRQDVLNKFPSGTRTYERMLKVHIDQVMDDILYYLQYVTGFSDDIIAAIQKSLDLGKGHTPNLGNIINYFKVGESKKDFEVQLNMYELTNDPNMGNMTIGLGVINNDQTGGKNYVGKGSLSLTMPFTSAITMVLNSNDLELVNIGKPLDFTSLYNFISGYSYSENEEWEASNGSWKKASERTCTISFEANPNGKFAEYNGDVPQAITGVVNSEITLPSLANYSNMLAGGKDVYVFAGWYTDPKCKEGNEFTASTMPRGDTTLYAKWQLTQQWRTVTYQDYYGNTISTQYALVGTALNGTAEQTIITYSASGDKKYVMSFAGWQTASGDTIDSVTETQVLNPIYNIDNIYNKYSLYINTGVAEQDTAITGYNGDSIVSMLPGYKQGEELVKYDATTGTTTYYTFAGWFANSQLSIEFDGTMPSQDATIYANWQVVRVVAQRQISIYDNGELVYQHLYAAGEVISLPQNVMVNSDTQWYTDAGFTTLASYNGIMPDEDVVLHIRNKYTLTINYYGLTNKQYSLTQSVQSLYQGEYFSLPAQNNGIIEFGSGSSYYRMVHTFVGYKANGQALASNVMPNHSQEVSSSLNSQKQFKVTFDTRLFKPSDWVAGGHWAKANDGGTVSFTPADEYINEGETLNLNQDKYKPCIYGYQTAVNINKLKYVATSWGTSVWADKTKGGSGVTSIAINGSITLYACWAKS